MKKILASTLAILMTASMLTACGDSDSSSTASVADTTTTTTTTPAESSSVADEASSEDASSEEVAEPVDISEAPAALLNYETASMTFTDKTDPTKFVEAMAEKDETPDVDDAYPNDESRIGLSMEDVGGTQMIKVEVLDLKTADDSASGYKIPKLRLNMANIFAGHEDILPTINSVKIDVIYRAVGDFTGEDGTVSHVPGNFMGAICAQTIKDVADPTALNWIELNSQISASEWTSEWGYCEIVGNDVQVWGKFQESTDAQYFTFMRWSIVNDACFYIADITFLDADGNVIAVENSFDA